MCCQIRIPPIRLASLPRNAMDCPLPVQAAIGCGTRQRALGAPGRKTSWSLSQQDAAIQCLLWSCKAKMKLTREILDLTHERQRESTSCSGCVAQCRLVSLGKSAFENVMDVAKGNNGGKDIMGQNTSCC